MKSKGGEKRATLRPRRFIMEEPKLTCDRQQQQPSLSMKFDSSLGLNKRIRKTEDQNPTVEDSQTTKIAETAVSKVVGCQLLFQRQQQSVSLMSPEHKQRSIELFKKIDLECHNVLSAPQIRSLFISETVTSADFEKILYSEAKRMNVLTAS
jgi:hypothetical protein